MLPEFTQTVKRTIEKSINGIHTAFPGRIEKYDPKKNLANVQPVMKFKKPNGEVIDYPLLTGVPVWFPQTAGQKATIAFPIKKGDECLVVVSERSIDYWMQGKETSTDLMFDLTEALCIPGLFSKANPLFSQAGSEDAIIIQRGQTFIKIKADEIILDSQEKVVVNSDKDITLNSDEKIRLYASDILISGEIETSDTPIPDPGGDEEFIEGITDEELEALLEDLLSDVVEES